MKSFACALAAMVMLLLAFIVWRDSQYKSEVEHLLREMSKMSDALHSQARSATSEANSARELAEEVARLRADALRTASMKSPLPAMTARQDDPADPVEPGPTVSSQVISPEQVTQHIETAFHSEAMDTTWARDARKGLQEKLANLVPKASNIGSLECHASLCRVELRHPDEEQYQQFMQRITHGETFWKGASMTYRSEDDDRNITTISYLAREGHTMPFPNSRTR